MRISDWSSDVCSSDRAETEEIDHGRQDDRRRSEEPQTSLVLPANEIEGDRREKAEQRQPERGWRNGADDRGEQGDRQDSRPGDRRLWPRRAGVDEGDA